MINLEDVARVGGRLGKDGYKKVAILDLRCLGSRLHSLSDLAFRWHWTGQHEAVRPQRGI
jgi:hypothetical protein